MELRLDQLKKIKLPLDACGPEVSMYDIITSYANTKPLVILPPLDGSGTQNSPLQIASVGATVGQVLTWNGVAWVASTPTTSSNALLSLSTTLLSLIPGNTVDLLPLRNYLYSAGAGISISTGVITSTLNLNAGSNISITGTFPNLTISASGTPSAAYPLKATENPTVGLNTHTFTGIAANLTRLVDVYLNGVLKTHTEDYEIGNTPNTTLTFTFPFQVEDRLTIRYYN